MGRLDLVRRTYQIPSSFRDLRQIRDYLEDHRHDLRFVPKTYAKLPRVKTWPKVVVEEKYSRRHSDPTEDCVESALGQSICPSRLSYFQLMALCIRLKISLSPAVATTRDRILQRVENFISVSDNIQNFSDGGVDWLNLKEDSLFHFVYLLKVQE